MNRRRHESPVKRKNPSDATVWVARYTNRQGKRVSAGTFNLKREAQAAIDAAYAQDALAPRRPDTVGAYFATWLDLHPRSERTNRTNAGRIRQVLGVDIEGVPLRHWPLADLKRRHALVLVDVMLRDQGRAYTGAQAVLRSLSAMTEDAIVDEIGDTNPFKGVKVRANDPRIRKQRIPIRVWTWEDMRRLAAACGAYEPMVRLLSDCGLRLGEVPALRRSDWHGDTIEIRRTAWEGRVLEGTKTDHGEQDAGRVVPVPPELETMLRAMPKRIDTPLLFPTPRGAVWRESNWRRDVWGRAREATGVDARPHEFRHSFITHMRAAGVNDADLAQITGHTVATMIGRYSHALGQSFEAVRGAVG